MLRKTKIQKLEDTIATLMETLKKKDAEIAELERYHIKYVEVCISSQKRETALVERIEAYRVVLADAMPLAARYGGYPLSQKSTGGNNEP